MRRVVGMNFPVNTITDLFESFTRNWTRFLVIHIAVNIIALLVLAPAATNLLQFAISLSGNAALSDQDIFFFFLSPGGFLSLLIIGSLFSIIVFLEHAALLISALSAEEGEPVSMTRVLRFISRRSADLFQLALLLLVRVIIGLLPFLLTAAVTYFLLLSDYDINYYLAEKPAEWRLAMVLAAILTAAAGVNLLRQFISWIYCLPLFLFRGCTPLSAIKESRAAVRGHRIQISAWLLGWLLFSLLLTSAASLPLTLLGDFFIPRTGSSVGALLLVLGLFALIAFLISFTLTFINSVMLSLVNLKLFRERIPAGVKYRLFEVLPESPSYLNVSRKVLSWGLLAGLLISILFVWVSINRLGVEDRTEIMAHRGASAVAPENTLAAVQAAIDSGAHWVEIDVQETADGEIVVIHDSDLKKIGSVPLVVATSTLRELQEVDIGSWFGPDFSDQRIPTLAQVLAMCKDKIGVNIELKYYGKEKLLEQGVAETVEAAGMVEQVVIMTLNYAGIRKMRDLRPDWSLGLLSSVALGDLTDLDVDFLALNGRAASRQHVRSVQGRGKKVMVWTINDAVGISNMMGRGVDAIITDDPALAISILEQRQDLEPIQRLLMQLADVFDQPSLYKEQ